uniref:Uncharacterized protein n=1 Tax=Cannabis sativa TaxID=3483 RepID=A0A803P3Z1_CANSA
MAETSTSNDPIVKGVNVITTRSGKNLEDQSIKTTTSNPKVALDSATLNAQVKVPFPQTLRPVGKILENQVELLKHLTQVKINLLLLHVIKQVSAYVKIIKDLCTAKRKHHVKKTAFLTEQLADRSIEKPRGIVQDVLIQIEKFYYPVDFLVLATQSVVNIESKIPIILGRPFFATVNALINCQNGPMKISFGNMTLEVNIFHTGKQLHVDDDCHQTFMIDNLVSEEIQLGKKFWKPHFEALPRERETLKSSAEEIPNVQSNQLPEGLKYVFLADGETFPVIISSNLQPSEELQLLELLRKYRLAIGWTLADTKGISP